MEEADEVAKIRYQLERPDSGFVWDGYPFKSLPEIVKEREGH